jgi:hypothetical protein
MEDPGEGTQKGGLAEAGNALEQDVAAGEEAGEDAFDDVVLADDDSGNLLAHEVEASDCLGQGRMGGHVFIVWQGGGPSRK